MNRGFENKCMKLAWTKMLVPLTCNVFLQPRETITGNQTISVTVSDTSVNWCFEPVLMRLQLSQVWLAPSPENLIHLLAIFWVFIAVCFGSLSVWRTHNLRMRPSLLTLRSTFCSRIPLVVWRFRCTLHRFKTPSVKRSEAAPETQSSLRHVSQQGQCSFVDASFCEHKSCCSLPRSHSFVSSVQMTFFQKLCGLSKWMVSRYFYYLLLTVVLALVISHELWLKFWVKID